jgi:regulator of protease activity HflC (stomatin/prohibitin superfamily)
MRTSTNTARSTWLVNTGLTPLDPEECNSKPSGKMTKALQEAYSIATEGHDIDHFKKILADHQEELARLEAEAQKKQEEAEAKAAAKAEKDAKAKDAAADKKKKPRKSTSKVDEDDVEMEDAEAPKSSKKRKKEPDSDGEGPKVSTIMNLPIATSHATSLLTYDSLRRHPRLRS